MKKLRTILLIAAFAALICLAFKWFFGLASDNYSDYDGGRGKYEQSVEDSL
jgi:hypothetical protein